MKGAVKIAYWDTAQGNPPRLVGQIRGTPTIKFIYPSKKNKRDSHKKKIVSDYNGERKADAMFTFAAGRMPNFIQRISNKKSFETFAEKADKYALPKFVVVTKEPSSTPIVKSLSTEVRRRALVAEVRASKPNKDIIAGLALNDWLRDKSAPKTVVVALTGPGTAGKAVPMKKSGKYPPFKLSITKKFFNKFALKKPYYEDEEAQKILAERKATEDEAKTAKSEL